MKKLTKEGIFECGLMELARGKACALTAVIQPHGMGLGLAVANEPGYHPIPLHWCNGDNFIELHDHADELNRELFNLEPRAAATIVSSTMAAQNRKARAEQETARARVAVLVTVSGGVAYIENEDGEAPLICEIRDLDNDGEEFSDEERAQAKKAARIAHAAPELAEALQELMHRMRPPAGKPTPGSLSAQYEQCRAILAKASS